MNRIIPFINNIRKVISIHSFPTIIRICYNLAYNKILFFTPLYQHDRNLVQNIDLEFDKKWGLDTGGIIAPEKSDIVGSNWLSGQKYQGCDPKKLIEVLNLLGITYEQFSFVDLGSGKGRAIIVASSFPFKNIIGVEYSRKLADIARINISKYTSDDRKCKNIEVICTDASFFTLPEDPLVIFIFNSFGKRVMRSVLINISNSYLKKARRIIVLYFNAEFADVLRDSGFMKEIRISKTTLVFDTQYS
jgi:precorrin-6B methylase 2